MRHHVSSQKVLHKRAVDLEVTLLVFLFMSLVVVLNLFTQQLTSHSNSNSNSSSSLGTLPPRFFLFASADTTQQDIYIICPDLTWAAANLESLQNSGNFVSETVGGLAAALHEVNSKGGVHDGSRKVRCTQANASDVYEVMEMTHNQSHLAILNWFIVEDEREASEATLIQENILSIANVASEPEFYDWHPNYINMFASKKMELFSFVSYLLGTLKLKRVCTFIIKYEEGHAVGTASIYELAVVREAFAALNMEPVCHLEVPYDATTEEAGLMALTIAPYNPQAMIMIGYPTAVTGATLGSLWYANLGIQDGFVMIGDQLWQSVALQTFETINVLNIGSKIKVVTVASSPAYNQAGSSFAQQLTEAVKDYDDHHSSSNSFNITSFTATGYYAGRAMIELLEMTTTLTRAGLRKQIYQNSIIRVNENTHGMFSETEDPNEVVLPIGRCNQGGRQTHIHVLSPQLEVQGLGPFFSMSSIKCAPDYTDIRRSVYLPTLVRSSSTTMTSFFHTMVVNGSHGLVYTHLPSLDIVTYDNSALGTTRRQQQVEGSSSEQIDAFTQAYSTVQNEKNVMAHMAPQVLTVSGLPTKSTVDGSASPFIDPVPLVPELAVTDRNDILYFNPTLDQQIFALMNHIASSTTTTGSSTVVFLMRGSVSTEVSAAAAQAFYTVGLSGFSTSRFSALSSTFLATFQVDFLMVLGIQTTAEVEVLVVFLAANPGVTLLLEYQEYTQHYEALTAHPSYSPNTAARILVASSFPPLMANTTVLERNFHTYLGSGVNPTPLMQQGYVLGRVLTSLLGRMDQGTSSSEFLNTLLETSVVGIESGTQFGPFSNTTEDEGSRGCTVGARVVHIQSLGATADSSTTTFVGCSVPYTYPVENSLDPWIIVMIVVLCALTFVIIGLFVVVFVLGQAAVRDISNAPKDASKPFAVMFTDIQASTSLWSRLPANMGPAMDSHHQIIRALIAKHKCYEVKTIGDAFLVVHTDPVVLVQLAKDLQEDFYKYDWGTARFDEAYKETELEAYEKLLGTEAPVADRAIAEPPSAKDPNYAARWNGLRVRIGIHYGFGEVQFDEVSKGYDYYGTVVNTASRVESSAHGGQILVSATVLDKYLKRGDGQPSPSSSANPEEIESLGSVILRGVDAPTELFQIHFRQRRYDALMNTVLGDVDGKKSNSDFNREGSGHVTIAGFSDDADVDLVSRHSCGNTTIASGGAAQVAKQYLAGKTPRVRMEMEHSHSLLSLLISPASEAEKVDMVKKLATRWRVDQSMVTKKNLEKGIGLDWGLWSIADRVTLVHMESKASTPGIHTTSEMVVPFGSPRTNEQSGTHSVTSIQEIPSLGSA